MVIHLGNNVLVASQMRVALGAAEDASAIHVLFKDASHCYEQFSVMTLYFDCNFTLSFFY